MNEKYREEKYVGRENSNLRRGSNSRVSDRGDYGRGGDNDATRHRMGGERWKSKGGNNKRRLESSPIPHDYVVNRTGDKFEFPRGLSKSTVATLQMQMYLALIRISATSLTHIP